MGKGNLVRQSILAAYACSEFDHICDGFSTDHSEYFRTMIESICSMDVVETCMHELRGFDEGTYGHSVRTGLFSILIGYLMGCEQEFVKDLGMAGFLHDIGKTFIPWEIINNDRPLSNIEFDVVRVHAAMGTYYLEKQHDIYNMNVIAGVSQHHERLDGTGYPLHLVGLEVSIPGRVVAISDVLEAYSHKRSYHDKRTLMETFHFMQSVKGLDQDMIRKLYEHADFNKERIAV